MSSISWRLFWRINSVIIALVITVGSLVPDPEAMGAPMSWSKWIASLLFGDPMSGDKVSHFLAYGALAFFSTLGFVSRLKHLLILFIGLLLYGGLMEGLQALGGVRSSDALDLVANALGALSGIIGALFMRALFDHFSIHLRTPIVR